MQKIIPFLWFDNNAEEAIAVYTSLFPDSKVQNIQKYPVGSDDPHMKDMEGKVMTAVFDLAGFRMMALDGGQEFKKTPAISFTVACDSVEEVEKYWNTLSEGGTVRMPLDTYPFSEKYGWCDDKFGTSWQISVSESPIIFPNSLGMICQDTPYLSLSHPHILSSPPSAVSAVQRASTSS